MKKLFKSTILALLVLTLVACSSGDKGTDKPANDKLGENSLYLITDVGTIDDRSFNQGSWEGLKQYADEIGVKPVYLQPKEESDQEYLAQISTAVEAGAKVVVTPGFMFEKAVHEAQTLYPKVKFILVDGEPRANQDAEAEYQENTVGILYQEEQAGFLAGYAAVKEGFTKLGYMGGYAVPAVVRFGYGYVDGANYAAKEMDKQISVRYTYLNSFNPDPQWEAQASAWYVDGIEVIFSAAGGAGNSVMASAAKADNKWVIGVDVDQKAESEKVLTSSMKNLKGSVYEAVKSVGEGKFVGGKTTRLSIDQDMVQISDDLSRFKNFTKADYDAIVKKLKDDVDGVKKNIPGVESAEKITDLEFSNTTVELR